jgi:hypothetical protein
MTHYEKEKELLLIVKSTVNCVIIRQERSETARNLLGLVERHRELKVFAEVEKAYNFEEFVKGLKWIKEKLMPCVGGCRGGG